MRLVPSLRGRREAAAGSRLVVDTGSAAGAVRFRVAAGTSTVVYAAWLSTPTREPAVTADEAGYDTARAGVVRFWQHVLGAGAQYTVPEPRIQDAEQAMLVVDGPDPVRRIVRPAPEHGVDMAGDAAGREARHQGSRQAVGDQAASEAPARRLLSPIRRSLPGAGEVGGLDGPVRR